MPFTLWDQFKVVQKLSMSRSKMQYWLWCVIFYLASTTSYISTLSSYLCANVFIRCCCFFICLKFWKKWIYFVFFNVCHSLLIFPKRWFHDSRRFFFAENEIINIVSDLVYALKILLLMAKTCWHMLGIFSPKLPSVLGLWEVKYCLLFAAVNYISVQH